MTARLQLLDYVAMLRERKTWLAIAMMVYALLATPVLLARPPAHVQQAIDAWLGDDDPFAIFMYVWVDLVMNKMIAFVPVVLASGVVLRERDTGVLELLAAKPTTASRYFVMRTISACLVMLTLHVAVQLLGIAYFSLRVPSFRVAPFALTMSLHALGGVFATALASTIAIWIGRRGAAALASIFVLGMLVGMALIGFYQPAWRTLSLANPIALGAQGLAHLRALAPAALVPPALALVAITSATIALGAAGARRMEASS